MNAILRLLFLFLLPVACLQAQIPSYVPTNGLIGWWPFNGNANDESGNGNNGQIFGSSLTSDRNGVNNSAYSFNGIDNSIFLGNWFDYLEFSVSIWIKPSPQSGYVTVLDNNHTHMTNWVFHSLTDNQYYSWSDNPILLEPDKWHHIVFSYKDSTGQLYHNGKLAGELTTYKINYTRTPALTLGASVEYGRFWKGDMDEIGIWNRALDSNDILKLYQGTSSNCSYSIKESDTTVCPGNSVELNAVQTSSIKSEIPKNGLVGYWPFNGNANDESGNGNNGNVNGAILTTDRCDNQNQAFSFKAKSWIEVPNANYIDSNNIGSISFWVKSNSLDQLAGVCKSTSSDSIDFRIFGYANDISFIVNGKDFHFLNSSGNLDKSKWNNLIVTFNDNDKSLYINGKLQAKPTLKTTYPITKSTTMKFGFDNHGMPEYLDGSLDEIAIWKRVLTNEEVQQVYYSSPCGCTDTLSNDKFVWSDGQKGRKITVKPDTTTTYVLSVADGATLHRDSIKVTVGGDSCITCIYGIKQNDTTICQGTVLELNAEIDTVSVSIPKDGLIGWWPFNGNANDESGKGNNGIVDGASITTDRCGNSNQAYYFNGFSSKITIKDSPLLRPTSFTCSAWIYLEDDNHLNQILAKNAGEGPFESVDMCIHNGNGYNYLANIGGPDYYGTWLMSSDKVQLNKWQLMTFIFDDFKDSVYSYIDDKLVVQTYEAKSITYDTLPWSFGSERENGIWSWFFKGKIDDITIWNRPLAYNEIAQVYNASSCNCAEALTDDKYVWSSGQRGRKIMVKPDTTTSYILTVLDGSSIHRDSIKVTVHPNSITTILGSRFVCLSSTLEKYFVSKQNGESYFWYPPKLGVYTTNQVEDSVVIHWTTTGIDTLRVSINNTLTGCTRDTFIIVSVINAIEPKIATFGNQKTLCKGDSRGLECLTDAQSYQWKRNGKIIDGANDKIYLAFEAGEYTVHIKSGICEGESEILKLIEYDNPKPLILGEKNVVAGSDELEYRVSAQGVKSNLWSVSNNAIVKGSPLSDKINIQFPEPGKVKVSAKQESEFGCTGEDSIIIHVTSMTDVKEARSSSFEFFISPNPTGESDQFLVRFAEKQHQDISIELLDILGSVHYSNTLQAGNESCTIPVQGLSSGMYVIRLRINNEVFVEKVIVN